MLKSEHDTRKTWKTIENLGENMRKTDENEQRKHAENRENKWKKTRKTIEKQNVKT